MPVDPETRLLKHIREKAVEVQSSVIPMSFSQGDVDYFEDGVRCATTWEAKNYDVKESCVVVSLFERVEADQDCIKRIRYSYHIGASQTTTDETYLRYDNSDHYPSISTAPNHQHKGERVLPLADSTVTSFMSKAEDLYQKKKNTDQAK